MPPKTYRIGNVEQFQVSEPRDQEQLSWRAQLALAAVILLHWWILLRFHPKFRPKESGGLSHNLLHFGWLRFGGWWGAPCRRQGLLSGSPRESQVWCLSHSRLSELGRRFAAGRMERGGQEVLRGGEDPCWEGSICRRPGSRDGPTSCPFSLHSPSSLAEVVLCWDASVGLLSSSSRGVGWCSADKICPWHSGGGLRRGRHHGCRLSCLDHSWRGRLLHHLLRAIY